jgi:hypothetical protein
MPGDEIAYPQGIVGEPYPRCAKPRAEWTFRDWLVDQIGFLQSIKRTEFGEGSLSSYKAALKELDRYAG